jgi:hypothetical protein
MSILQAIDYLGQSTVSQNDNKAQVKKAFTLGLWFRSFPDYTLKHLENAYVWDLKEIDPESNQGYNTFDRLYPLIFKFGFVSDTGDSWHECYRAFRQLGWKREKVFRDGGRLQYLFSLIRDGMPEGYSTLHLLLNISIATCKQVQVGSKLEEVPIMKTVCEDLVEIEAEEEEGSAIADFKTEDAVVKVHIEPSKIPQHTADIDPIDLRY